MKLCIKQETIFVEISKELLIFQFSTFQVDYNIFTGELLIFDFLHVS